MNRGTVMETSKRKAVVLTPDGQFVRITVHRNVAIGEEISWTDSQLVPHRSSIAFRRTRWMSSAAAAAAVLILIFGLWSFRTPPVVAYVSMDINPSVEFGLDSHERVRELRAVNDDALPYLEGVAYKGKPIETVMEILARKLTESHVLKAGDGEIVIASVRLKSVDTEWEEQVTDKIERILLQVSARAGNRANVTASLDIEKLYLPVEVRDEAKANGISSGKMAFWLAAEQKGHEVPLASLQQQSLKNIAASWGGLKEVLDDGTDHDEDKETWKKLLADKKEKKKNGKEQKPSPSPTNEQPSPSAEPTASSDDQSEHQDKDKKDRNRDDDKQHSKDDKKSDRGKQNNKDDKKRNDDEKQSKDDDKQKSREEDRKSPNDDREQSQNKKQADRQRERDDSKERQDDLRHHDDNKQRDDRGPDDRQRNGDHNHDDHGD